MHGLANEWTNGRMNEGMNETANVII